MSGDQHIFDNHGRPISYLRLAVTDRCNLRCFYCMPENGIKYLPKNELLTYEEMERLVKLLVEMGINKLRITGGEPFVRQDLIKFIENISAINGLKQIAITTNGVLTLPYLKTLKELGIRKINLSLDSIDKTRFQKITRRDEFDKVMETLEQLIINDFDIKINCVVMQEENIEDIIPLLNLMKENSLGVRFIEEMPFNGEGSKYNKLRWDHLKILKHISATYPNIYKQESEPSSTSVNYKIPTFKGSFGIIPAFSRTFCGTCNRIRITAQGTLKTCLYDDGVLDLKHLLRSGYSDTMISEKLINVFSHRSKNGFEAESHRLNGKPITESMSTIGG